MHVFVRINKYLDRESSYVHWTSCPAFCFTEYQNIHHVWTISLLVYNIVSLTYDFKLSEARIFLTNTSNVDFERSLSYREIVSHDHQIVN